MSSTFDLPHHISHHIRTPTELARIADENWRKSQAQKKASKVVIKDDPSVKPIDMGQLKRERLKKEKKARKRAEVERNKKAWIVRRTRERAEKAKREEEAEKMRTAFREEAKKKTAEATKKTAERQKKRDDVWWARHEKAFEKYKKTGGGQYRIEERSMEWGFELRDAGWNDYWKHHLEKESFYSREQQLKKHYDDYYETLVKRGYKHSREMWEHVRVKQEKEDRDRRWGAEGIGRTGRAKYRKIEQDIIHKKRKKRERAEREEYLAQQERERQRIIDRDYELAHRAENKRLAQVKEDTRPRKITYGAEASKVKQDKYADTSWRRMEKARETGTEGERFKELRDEKADEEERLYVLREGIRAKRTRDIIQARVDRKKFLADERAKGSRTARYNVMSPAEKRKKKRERARALKTMRLDLDRYSGESRRRVYERMVIARAKLESGSIDYLDSHTKKRHEILYKHLHGDFWYDRLMMGEDYHEFIDEDEEWAYGT